MRQITRDGLTFDVRDEGPDDGPAVLLLHGFPQDGTAYDGVAARLRSAGCRTVVPDQRGYSPGARPQQREAYAVRELVEDAVAVLDQLGVPTAHVVGHDWGGAVAWAVAGRYRDRVSTLTALSTPHPAALSGAMLRSTQGLRSAYMGLFQLPVVPERALLAGGGWLLRNALLRSGLPEDWADHYTARMREPGALAGALAWYRAIPTDPRFRVGRPACPVTLVAGRRDPAFSGTAVRGSEGFVAGRMRLVELDAGHWLPERHAAEVAEEVLANVRRVEG
jgi:pimeloyl-ACP methyl ester carboxylesterase